MRSLTNFLSKVLVVLHYPAAVGGFVFCYPLVQRFGTGDLIATISWTCCLGAVTTLLLNVFHSLWASDNSLCYLFYGRQTLLRLDIASFVLTILPVGLVAIFAPVRLWQIMLQYLMLLPGVFVAQIGGIVTLMLLLARRDTWEKVPVRREPKITLAETIESLRQSTRTVARPPVRSPAYAPVSQSGYRNTASKRKATDSIPAQARSDRRAA